MSDSRSLDIRHDVTCTDEAAAHWLHQFGIDAPIASSGPISVCMQSSESLLLDYDGMRLSLGQAGAFKKWYTHLPWPHPLLKIVKKLFQQEDHLTIHDATCGLGRDSLLIALYIHAHAPNGRLISYEQNPLCAALAAWQSQAFPRWQVIHAPFQQCESATHVLIDPMFPPHPKTALPNKYSQMLQQLTAHDHLSDGPCLIAHGKSIGAHWLCVKQPPWEKKVLWQIQNSFF